MATYWNDATERREPLTLPSDRSERARYLEEQQLFRCPACRLYCRWSFGADVGHPDIDKIRNPLTNPNRLGLFDALDEYDAIRKLDAYLRKCCDRCWARRVKELGCADKSVS
jgi:epoxyqueuosine reductase QueG